MEDFTQIFAWGLDTCGQLGLGPSSRDKKHPSPLFCSFNVLIRDMSCGEDHSCFISDLGLVYSMGSNANGKLGINDRKKLQSSSPVLVEGLASYKCVKVSCGWTHSAVITKDLKLFTWGSGEFGALGLGKSDDLWQPVEIFNDVQDVSCGSHHTGIVRKSSLYTCGAGETGQLGTGRRQGENLFTLISQNNVRQVSCGVFHSGFVTEDGEVWLMGGNSYGQLGTGNKKTAVFPVKVNLAEAIKLVCGNCTACICSDGLYIWGLSTLGEFLLPKKVKVSNCQVLDVCIGGSFILAQDSKNLYSWGHNTNGELGLGDLENRNSPCLVSALSGKKVKKMAAGGNFVICLGQDVREQGKECFQISKTARETRTGKLAGKTTNYEREVLKPKENCTENNLDSLVSALKNENAQLKENLNRHQRLADCEKSTFFEEAFQKLKEKYLNEITQLKTQLESQACLQKALEHDLQLEISHSSRLEKCLSGSQPLARGRRDLRQADFDVLGEQNNDLQVSLETSKIQFKDLQSTYSSLVQENSYLKQALSGAQQESLKLAGLVSDLQSSVGRLNDVINTQETRICVLTKKNSELEQEVLEVHEKNEEIVRNFEKEVSQKARKYCDKTVSILSSRKNRDFANDGLGRNELSEGQLEKIKNAVRKLVEADSVSPVRTRLGN